MHTGEHTFPTRDIMRCYWISGDTIAAARMETGRAILPDRISPPDEMSSHDTMLFYYQPQLQGLRLVAIYVARLNVLTHMLTSNISLVVSQHCASSIPDA